MAGDMAQLLEPPEATCAGVQTALPVADVLPETVDTPTPVNGISREAFDGSLLSMVSVEFLLPTLVGVWVRVMVQLLPTAMAGEYVPHALAPLVTDILNMAASVPPRVREDTCSSAVPVLAITISIGAVDEYGTLPKAGAVGVTAIALPLTRPPRTGQTNDDVAILSL